MRITFLSFLIMIISGCADARGSSGFMKLKSNTTYDQMVEIVGKPDNIYTRGDSWVYEWVNYDGSNYEVIKTGNKIVNVMLRVNPTFASNPNNGLGPSDKVDDPDVLSKIIH